MTTPPEHPGMPRWLRISLLVVAIILVVLVVSALLGVGGPHGPGRHGLGQR